MIPLLLLPRKWNFLSSGFGDDPYHMFLFHVLRRTGTEDLVQQVLTEAETVALLKTCEADASAAGDM